jgi:tartrate dehydratase beta subunit/fumarate hydratase class I family protein
LGEFSPGTWPLGMDRQVLETLKEFNCIYLAQVGGCGALYAKQVRGIKGPFWEDLGFEKVLAFEIEDYGPLLVAMDNKRKQLVRSVREEVNRRIPQASTF